MSEEEETNLQRVTFIQSQDGRLSVVAEQIGVFDRTNVIGSAFAAFGFGMA